MADTADSTEATITEPRFELSELIDRGCAGLRTSAPDAIELWANDPREVAIGLEMPIASATLRAKQEIVSVNGFDGTSVEVLETESRTTDRAVETLVSTTVRLDIVKDTDSEEETVFGSTTTRAWYVLTDRVVARAPRKRHSETPPSDGWRIVTCKE